jgi:hypothetical protein
MTDYFERQDERRAKAYPTEERAQRFLCGRRPMTLRPAVGIAFVFGCFCGALAALLLGVIR